MTSPSKFRVHMPHEIIMGKQCVEGKISSTITPKDCGESSNSLISRIEDNLSSVRKEQVVQHNAMIARINQTEAQFSSFMTYFNVSQRQISSDVADLRALLTYVYKK